MSHFCPRRDDTVRWMASQKSGATFYLDPELQVGKTPLEDQWREEGLRHAHITGGLPTCSYCGSLRPQDFVAALTRPGVEIHGTDKRYKAYVILPNPNAGNPRITSASKTKPDWGTATHWQRITPALRKQMKAEGWAGDYEWVLLSPDSGTSQAKFYFQHLAHPSPERAAFYDWYLEHPGIFYSGPPVGLNLEYFARHPEQMSEVDHAALAAFRERNPGIAAP